jgi:hypothetical protein
MAAVVAVLAEHPEVQLHKLELVRQIIMVMQVRTLRHTQELVVQEQVQERYLHQAIQLMAQTAA